MMTLVWYILVTLILSNDCSFLGVTKCIMFMSQVYLVVVVYQVSKTFSASSISFLWFHISNYVAHAELHSRILDTKSGLTVPR